MKKPDPKQIQQEREKWGALVGRFILSFGDVENITYLALLQLPKDKIFETTSRLGFGQRVDLVQEIIAGHAEVPEDLKKAFATELAAAKKLAETRNTVAHSPLMLTIYEHPGEGWMFSKLGLGNAKNKEKAVSLEVLTAAVDQAEALAKKLYELYAQVHKLVAKGA